MERQIQMDPRVEEILFNVEKVIIGKDEVVELLLTAMLAGGHVLLEDVPGVGKTQLAEALARSCGGTFGRLQMTPDVMPSDVTGFTLLRPGTGEMEFRKGAVFCNILLADEINRASPKSQAALLEAMEELQVSIDGVTYPLEKPFLVLATQNPVETYGTYALPEAQLDRFLMKLSLGYPDKRDELAILRKGMDTKADSLGAVVRPEDVLELRQKASEVLCSEAVENYIVDLAGATRKNEGIRLGASPRGSIALYQAAKAFAYIRGRNYCLPDDVKFLAPYVLGHRLILSPQGRSLCRDEQEMIRRILEEVPVPVE